MEAASAIDKRLTFFQTAYYKKSGTNYVAESMIPQNLTHYIFTTKYIDVDANGILNVSAKDKATGKEQSIRITSSSGLDKSEIEKMKNSAKEHDAEDKMKKENK